ncbi:molybdenum cofactor cytidylyltransferase [Clostridium sp. Mt-5]|uniref:Molybdenum cofactor cytidylyltransferase n=1 Tax=Clostridium moutaii TaxID=3240932 RepID=A0ABV4BRW1_9CLOT
MINAIIMASGYSSRMGTNKLLLPYKGKPLLEHTIDAITNCTFRQIILIAKDAQVINLAEKKGLRIVKNHKAYIGQSQSIKLGIINSPSADGYMFFTGDQPMLTSDIINALIECFKIHKHSIIVPRFKLELGSPVIFSKDYINKLLNLTEDTGGKSIINKNIDKVIFLKLKNKYPIFDIDTPDDYKTMLNIK